MFFFFLLLFPLLKNSNNPYISTKSEFDHGVISIFFFFYTIARERNPIPTFASDYYSRNVSTVVGIHTVDVSSSATNFLQRENHTSRWNYRVWTIEQFWINSNFYSECLSQRNSSTLTLVTLMVIFPKWPTSIICWTCREADEELSSLLNKTMFTPRKDLLLPIALTVSGLWN